MEVLLALMVVVAGFVIYAIYMDDHSDDDPYDI